MKWIETKVAFTSRDDALAVDLIAQAFYDLDAKGVVVDDPHLEPEEGWGPDAVPPPAEPAVTGYLPADHRMEDHRQHLEQALSRLAAGIGLTYRIDRRSIDEEDWAEAWKAFFRPQVITPRFAVKPTWCRYDPPPGRLVIEIDPGMAFGTGTHPTTTLCIRLLERYLRPDDAVLDVGTGSGILLVAADKLGAGRLAGIDRDPVAVEVAGGNLAQNRIDPDRVTLHCGDLTRNVSDTFDVVVANILAEVILDLLDDVGRTLRPDGVFICSGIITASRAAVADKLVSRGFEILETRSEEGWVALAGRKASPNGISRRRG